MSRPRITRLRLLAPAVALLAAALAALAPGAAVQAAPQPSLTVFGLEAAPGVVRFLLTARDLPPDAKLDPSKIEVAVGSTALRVDVKQESTKSEAAQLPPRGLVIVMDVSKSFETVLPAAKDAAKALARDLPPDVKLGLVTVSDQPKPEVAPTVDRAVFTAALIKLKAVGQTTPLWDGVGLAKDSLAQAGFQPDSNQRVLVFSDGAVNNSTLDPTTLNRALAAARLPVDTVAFQAEPGDAAALSAIASASGGQQVAAEDATGVAAGFRAAGLSFSVVLSVAATVPDSLALSSSRMDVTVRGTNLKTSVPVKFAAPVVPPAKPPVIRFDWVPDWARYALAGAVSLAVIILVLAVVWPRSKKHERIKQIANFGPARATPVKRQATDSAGGVLARTALAATASMMRSRGLEERIAIRLDQAGMKLKPHEWVLLRGCIMITFAAALFLLAGWLGVIFGLLLGWLVTMLYRVVKVDRRAQQFSDQLPDALQLVVGSLRSGFSLPQAFDALVRESSGPVTAEFGRAMAEQRLGADISDALERAAHRARSEDLGWAVIAVRIQREVGGNLAEVLQSTVDTMRERGRLRRHVRSLSAEGRLSAWILIGLPIVLSVVMFFTRRNYLAPLFTTSAGLSMLLFGLVLFVAGIIWMTRVIKVDA